MAFHRRQYSSRNSSDALRTPLSDIGLLCIHVFMHVCTEAYVDMTMVKLSDVFHIIFHSNSSSTCTDIYIYIYIYICVCVCVYKYTYIHTRISSSLRCTDHTYNKAAHKQTQRVHKYIYVPQIAPMVQKHELRRARPGNFAYQDIACRYDTHEYFCRNLREICMNEGTHLP
jgi:hypothetical protein